jgi:hypothetical protein
MRVVGGTWKCELPVRELPGRGLRRPRRPRGARGCVVWEFKIVILASAEGDDAPDRIVRRNANRYPISRHHLDSKAAHTAAQLSKYLVSLVTLNAIEPPAVNRHDRTLHVNQIILAQLLSFPIKDCAIL